MSTAVPGGGSGVPVTVLLSGGVDSAACLALYTRSKSPVEVLFVDYSQPAVVSERSAAQRIAAAYQVPFATISFGGLSVSPLNDIPGRNALFYFAALVHGGSRPRLIASGIHAGTQYYDCSPEFLEHVDTLIRCHTRECVRATAPFLDWTKGMIWEFSRSHGVPLELTRSCDSGEEIPCGVCVSCLDRAELR